jgi:hypothetical protein
MPTDIGIISAHDFARATAYGEFDLGMSKKALIEVASATTHLVNYRILLDTRKAQIQIPVVELWHLARELSNLGKAFYQETAGSTERFAAAAFFALCGQNPGFRIQTFTSFKDAIDWLTGMEPHA